MLQAYPGPEPEGPGPEQSTDRPSVPTRSQLIHAAHREARADWAEVQALRHRPRLCALEELVQAELRLLDARERPADGRARARHAEAAAAAAFAELHDRRESSRHGYPFRLAGELLEASRSVERAPYTFLLLLSVLGARAGPPDLDGTSLFEEVAAAAAASYLGGRRAGARSTVFGAPRRGSPAGFRAAVDHLCESIGEGGGCRERVRLRHQRDAKLDVVAWRSFADRRAGQVIAFGQCATGHDWTAKLSELQPRAFCALWLRDPLLVDPIRMFFVPFRIDNERWEEASVYGGVLFDRCRIVACSDELDADVRERCHAWSRHVVRTTLHG